MKMNMEIIVRFLTAFTDYLFAVLPWVAIGFFLSGLISEFVPVQLVERHLGGNGLKPILYSIFAGAVLPLCCIGALPVAISLYQKGARLGPVLALMVAAPATSISALLVSYAMLGKIFTVYIFFAEILMGLVMGVIGNFIKPGIEPTPTRSVGRIARDPICGMSVDVSNAVRSEYKGITYYFCCQHCRAIFENEREKYATVVERGIKERIISIFRYSFIDMVKRIGPALLLGLAIAAMIVTVAPIGRFIGDHLGGGFGYLFSLIFGLTIYICSTGSVPIVHAFVTHGMEIGAGMVLLLAGPVTSLATILVLKKEFGSKVLLTYLVAISVLALSLGYCFSILVIFMEM